MRDLRPVPSPDESLDGYLRRLAEAEFWPDVSGFLGSVDLQYGRQLIECAAKAEEFLDLPAGTLKPILPSLSPAKPRLKWRFERHHSAPVCPQCISEGKPHHQSWRHAFVTCFVEHGSSLIDTCPMCLETLQPGRGGYDSCHCGCPLDRLDRIGATDNEIALSALVGGQMHPTRAGLPPALAFRTPHDIGEFIYFLASEYVETVTGKQGKSSLPRTIAETRDFLCKAVEMLCAWPDAFRSEVSSRLSDGANRAPSAPARLGRWYQRLMGFQSQAYADFRKELGEIVRCEFDGPYVGGAPVVASEREWLSAAEAARRLCVRAERIVDAVANKGIPGRQYVAGFGHRHTVLHLATVYEIARNRARFADKKTARAFLGLARKQFDFLIAADFLSPCAADKVPPLVDGQYDLVSLADVVGMIARKARKHDGATVAFEDLHLRFTTDTAGLTEVFRRIANLSLRPDIGSTSGTLAGFRFSRSEVDAVLADARRGTGMTMQEVSSLTGWKGQCIAEWCRQGLLHSDTYEHAGRVGRMIRVEDLARFQAEYVPAAALAKRMKTSSRSLMARLTEAGVEVVGTFQEGPAWRGHLVPLAALAGSVLGHRSALEREGAHGTHADS